MSKLLRDAIRMMSGLLVMALVTLPLSSALAGWQDDWEKLEAAAKKEGKLALSVHSGATLRTAIMKFGAAYPEIKLLVSIDPTRKYIARVRQERKAGVYNIDVRVGGPRTNHRLIPENVYVPIKPALVLPEVLDGSKWLGGFDAGFTDLKKEISYCPTAGVSTLLRVNRDVVSEKEFNKLDDLLDPKWKGKFTMRDPRGIGAGNTMVNILLIAKGEDFVRRFLVDQKPVFSHVDRQVAEWLVRGQYPIATGVGATNIRRFQRQGLGLNVKELPIPELLHVNFAIEAISLMDRAPNPNAAKLFANWYLSKKGQAILSKIMDRNSRRIDVPVVRPDAKLSEERFRKMFKKDYQENQKYARKALSFAKEVLK